MKVKASIRLGGLITPVVFLVMLSCAFILGLQMKERISEILRNGLRRELLNNAALLSDHPGSLDDHLRAQAQAVRIGRALDVRVSVIDARGNLIGDSSLPAEKLRTAENHLDRPEVRQALDKGFGEDSRYSRTLKQNMLYMAVPLGNAGPRTVLRFARPLYDLGIFGTGIEHDLERLLPILFFLSLLAGFLIAYAFSVSLRRFAAMGERRIKGDYSGVFPLQRDAETATIALAFNVMSEEVRNGRWSAEWYRAALSGIREAVIVTDSAGDIILANPAASRKFRIEGDMLKSRPVKKLAEKSLRELLESLHAGRSALVREEVPLMTQRGLRTMRVSATPIMKDETFGGIVFVLNDITKLRNLERMRRDFVSSVSHELRTPLSSIRGYTETLLEGAMNDPEHATAFLGIILKESEQLTALVNDVLDLSKIESGRIDYHFVPTGVADAVNEALVHLSRSIEEKGIRLEITIPGDLPNVLADRAYLEIALRNILDNAVKYVDDRDGRIRVKAFMSGQMVRIEVEDNGIGISQNDLSRIFERFYRVDKARSRQSGGTGLGLSIVKHIMLAHKGSVEVRSRLNQGSVFSLTLPAAPGDSAGS